MNPDDILIVCVWKIPLPFIVYTTTCIYIFSKTWSTWIDLIFDTILSLAAAAGPPNLSINCWVRSVHCKINLPKVIRKKSLSLLLDKDLFWISREKNGFLYSYLIRTPPSPKGGGEGVLFLWGTVPRIRGQDMAWSSDSEIIKIY